MEPFGVGVAGCGFVGRGAHVPGIAGLENARLVAIADADQTRREKVVKKYGVDSAYADYRELVADPAVQAIIVSLPTGLHAEASLAALEAGKHVLCEMPLAADLAGGDTMSEAAESTGALLMPGRTLRAPPHYATARGVRAQGAAAGKRRRTSAFADRHRARGCQARRGLLWPPCR